MIIKQAKEDRSNEESLLKSSWPLHFLDDSDAVRVCLLLVDEVVFMGREEFLNVPLHILTLVEDFYAWDAYACGEYMWTFFYQRTSNVVPKHVEMHLKLKNQAGKKMATYNLNGFVWALKDSIPILELTPIDKELKETWLIDQATIRSEETNSIDDHIPTCLTDSNTLLKDVDSLFKEVIDVRPDLVGRVGELRTKIVQTLASTVSTKETVVGNSFDASLKPNYSNRDQLNFYYQESQQGSLQHLVKAMEQVMSPDVSCLKSDKLDEQRFDDALQDNAEANLDETLKDNAEMVDTMDNEDGKFCLDDMSIGFEKDHLNGEIKVTLYQNDHIPLDETMDVAVKDTPVVTDSSPVVKTIVLDNQCITDVMDAENNTVGFDTQLLKHGFGLVKRKRKPGLTLQSPYEQQQPTTPRPEKRRTITSQLLELQLNDDSDVANEELENIDSREYTVEEILPFYEVALAYRERMLGYFWKYKVSYQLHVYDSS
ncbi:hypothetical protein Tco_1282626 [Tanacetum coccineum]